MLTAMHESPIVVVGTVVRPLRSDLFEIELPNGKRTTGHFSKALKEAGPDLQPNQRVRLEMTPFDFDSARISALVDS